MQRARSERVALVFVKKAAAAKRELSVAEINGLMYFADKESLRVAGRSLTGARYRAGRNGPVVLGLDDLLRGSMRSGWNATVFCLALRGRAG